MLQPDPGHAGQPRLIAAMDGDAIRRLELSASDRGLEIGQAEVVADDVVPIPLVLPHPVISQRAAACRKRIVGRHNHPALAGRKWFS
jgi:hypothetical protein